MSIIRRTNDIDMTSELETLQEAAQQVPIIRHAATMVMAFAALFTVSEARADYVTRPDYLAMLQAASYDGNGQMLYKGTALGLPSARLVLPTYVRVGESDQCVALPKAVAGCPQTSGWRQGSVVRSTTRRGTVLATFSNGKYSGHTCVFDYMDSAGNIYVWDQNWFAGKMGRHVIKASGTGVGKASNYYVVE